LKKIINKFVFDKMLMLVAGGKKVRNGVRHTERCEERMRREIKRKNDWIERDTEINAHGKRQSERERERLVKKGRGRKICERLRKEKTEERE
jgi:hypothetical protein